MAPSFFFHGNPTMLHVLSKRINPLQLQPFVIQNILGWDLFGSYNSHAKFSGPHHATTLFVHKPALLPLFQLKLGGTIACIFPFSHMILPPWISDVHSVEAHHCACCGVSVSKPTHMNNIERMNIGSHFTKWARITQQILETRNFFLESATLVNNPKQVQASDSGLPLFRSVLHNCSWCSCTMRNRRTCK